MSLNQTFGYTTRGGGKYLSSIDFEINKNISGESIRQKYNTVVVGTLSIGDNEYNLNSDEIDHVIDTLQRAKDVFYKKYVMGL